MNGRTIVLGLLAVVVLAGCSLPVTTSAGHANQSRPDSMTVRITSVEDGDTYWFENASGGSVGIRLIGVDTPEIKGQNYPDEYRGIPNDRAGKRWLYRWGEYVTNRTRDRLVGKTVRLEFDPNLPKRDYYGRLVAYVYLNGTLVNRDLLEKGYARVYPVEFEKRQAFKRTAAAARKADRGLWNYGNGTVP